jgi:hypothetical protein
LEIKYKLGMATHIKITINNDYVIDIDQLKVRDFERFDFERESNNEKIYPLPCQSTGINKLILKRTYKAICTGCSCLTSTYDKNRVAFCIECEKRFCNTNTRIKAICYKCNNTTFSFKKDRCGFICIDCSNNEIQTILSYCPICEYEIHTTKKGIHICESCKSGNIRIPRILRETRVLCCNCEQVAIQLNTNNPNVYCMECKDELFMVV